MIFHSDSRIFGCRLLSRLVLLFLIAGTLEAAEIHIRYISVDLVYLDAGREAGLAEGAVLQVRDGERVKALLKVVSVTANTASCTISEQTAPPLVGDLVVRVAVARTGDEPAEASEPETEPETEAEPAEAPRTRQRAENTSGSPQKRPRSPLSGTVSAQYFAYQDSNNSDYDYQQPGLRLNIRAKELFGGDYQVRIKTRTRYLSRADSQSGPSPTQWTNRIYEASFSYENEASLFDYRLGRIISNAFSGVGYIDGGLVQAKISPHGKVGLFAGTQPEWQYSDLQTSLQKYGAYYHYNRGESTTGRFESTFALSGQYHSGITNREYAYFRNLYQLGSRFYFFQSAEVDINRGWRKEKADESLALSNLYAFARVSISDGLKLGLSFDDRRSYYTYELRNRDEEFFDDNARRGVRADFQARLSENMRLSGQYGLRTREGQDGDASNYLVNFYHRRLFINGLTLNLKLTGFDNGVSQGNAPSIRVGKRFSSGDSLALGYSSYTYTFLQTDVDRDSQWLRLEGNWSLGRRLFLTGDLEFNSGDDAEGYRLYLEMGYRL